MVEITLRNTEGEVVEVMEYPTEPKEVKIKHFIEFEKTYEEFSNWQVENNDKDPLSFAFRKTYCGYLKKCVDAFCGEDTEGIAVGDYIKHLAKISKVAQKELDLDSIESTLFSLYENIWGTIGKYKAPSFLEQPKSAKKRRLKLSIKRIKKIKKKRVNSYVFEYKGKEYFIKGSFKDAITQNERFYSLSNAQMTEALEAWRIFEENQAKDTEGSFYYSTILNIISCVALQKGETFPTSDEGIQMWLSERVIHFQDIDMQTALDVQAFFFGTTKASRRTQDISGSSSPPLKSSRRKKSRTQKQGRT